MEGKADALNSKLLGQFLHPILNGSDIVFRVRWPDNRDVKR